nr:ATP-binding protein [Bacteriovorax sp. HI3]
MAKAWNYKKLKAIQYLFILLISFSIVSFFTLNIYSSSELAHKVLFSRLRYIGYALLCPSSLLFISSITNRLNFLHKKPITFALFTPAVITILSSLDLIPKDLLVTNHLSTSIYGLAVVQFDNGPLFLLHYLWSNLLIVLACALLFLAAFQKKERFKDYLILSLGMVCGYLIDLYSVAFNPPFRFTMISAGTFLISECAIFYFLQKSFFFELAKEETKISDKFHFQNKLLSLVGHDLSGNIHQLARLSNTLRNSDEGNQELIKVINDTSLSSAELISNVMRWVKSQGSHDFTIQQESINLKELLPFIIDSLSPVYPEIKQKVVYEINPEPLYLKADKEMLASILRNLLTNAYKACAQKKEPCIFIKVNQTTKGTLFEINDDGVGLEKNVLENLFQSSRIKSSGQGYGIGLYLVKMMIEIHRGTIEMKSQKNQGTQVSFYFPS